MKERDMTRAFSDDPFVRFLLEFLKGFWHIVKWWTNHAYRIEKAYESSGTCPVAYMWVDGQRVEQPVKAFNGSAYKMADGVWYGPQDIHDIVTLKYACGG